MPLNAPYSLYAKQNKTDFSRGFERVFAVDFFRVFFWRHSFADLAAGTQQPLQRPLVPHPFPLTAKYTTKPLSTIQLKQSKIQARSSSFATHLKIRFKPQLKIRFKPQLKSA